MSKTHHFVFCSVRPWTISPICWLSWRTWPQHLFPWVKLKGF